MTLPIRQPRIMYEDTHLAVLEKPAGWLSQGGEAEGPNLVDWLRNHFGRNYVGLVHRLDRNVSGLMVVAKRSKSAQRLTDALQKGKICRVYLALVEGKTPDTLELRHYLKKNPRSNQVTVFNQPTAGAKEALLSAKKVHQCVYRAETLSLLEIVLETGRSHQIRSQLSQQGWPLVGDKKYKARLPILAENRLGLHSHRLEFPHPMSGETLRYISKLPGDLADLAPDFRAARS